MNWRGQSRGRSLKSLAEVRCALNSIVSSFSKQSRSTRTHEQKLWRSGIFTLTLSGSLTMMVESQCLSQSPSSDWDNWVLLWRDYSQIVGQLILWKFHVSWPERQTEEVLTGTLENLKTLRKSCSLEGFFFSRERQPSQPNSTLTLLHLLLVYFLDQTNLRQTARVSIGTI